NMFCNYYTNWTPWNKCNKHCMQTRKRKCKDKKVCGKARFKEKRTCQRGKKCPNHVLKIMGSSIRNRRIEDRLYDIFYKPWTEWYPCNRKCVRRRRRRCKRLNICAGGYLEEQRPCSKTENACKKVYTLVTKSNNRKANRKMITQNVVDFSANFTFDGLKNVCGARPPGSARSIRIVGGRESKPNSWPWQVEIVTKQKKHLCGGTLIAPRWVITAAHCLMKRVLKGAKMLVRLGEHNKKVSEGTENDIAIKKFHLHEKFDYSAVRNDIALIELKKPIGVTNITGYACLPSRKQRRRKNILCSTIGWGRTNITNRRGSKVLREVEIPIVKRKKCKKAFNFKITKFQICAGYRHGGKDACVGDSGGPLMCPELNSSTQTTKWYITGVTSYGEGCGQKNKFGIYVNVARYISWIKSKISKKP
ncbi:hypothetical protein FSP39_022242, partial [Pinctada imbricata]